jgi:capsular polysaccharide biosynthesis protein
MKKSFIPLETLEVILNQWWLVAVIMIVGGFAGLLISHFNPSIYESKASFSVSIDYTRTGVLTDIQEDDVMRGIGSLINSDEMLQKVVDAVAKKGVPMTLQEMKLKTSLDRQDYRWLLRVRDSNPVTAAQLVNLWADQSNQFFIDAESHALRLDGYLRYLDSLESCLKRTTSDINAVPCDFPDLPKIVQEIQSTGQMADKEREASHGLMAAVSVQLVEKGQIPIQPVIFNRNLLVLAGAVIGLLISLALIFIRPNKRREK